MAGEDPTDFGSSAGGRSPFPLPQQAPQSIIRLRHRHVEVAHILGRKQSLPGGVQERQPAPAARWNRLGKRLQRAKVDTVVGFFGAGMVRLVVKKLAAAAQLVAPNVGQTADRPTILAEGPRQEEGQPVDAQRLGRRGQRDPVPAEQTGDLQIARRTTDADEDEVVLQQLVDGLSPRPSPPAPLPPGGRGVRGEGGQLAAKLTRPLNSSIKASIAST